MTTTVYTDGACLGNPGPGGWAWAVPGGAHASGAEAQSTNQRMEVMAALEALRTLDGPLVIVSDSTYVVNCFKNGWYVAWERKGWRSSAGSAVANQDLWRPMVEIFHARGSELRFEWVKGHSNNVMNDLVDRLAVEAARSQTGRGGSSPPTSVGPPDSTGVGVLAASAGVGGDRAGVAGDSAGVVDVAKGRAGVIGVPAGWRITILGHRPLDLGGYADNPIAASVRRRVARILGGLAAVHPDVVLLTGLGLGAEQLGALAAADAGVGYVAVLAFPEPDAKWPAASRATFRRLLGGAAATSTYSAVTPVDTRAAGMAIGRRDDWLTTNADGAVVVWDGKDAAIGHRVRALERRVPDDVWIVDPAG